MIECKVYAGDRLIHTYWRGKLGPYTETFTMPCAGIPTHVISNLMGVRIKNRIENPYAVQKGDICHLEHSLTITERI